jgi:seryl-tRNA(Sec) selenium transferase
MPENLFTRIGVRPLINARGTFTIVSGSRSLPEVKQAMYEASNYFVHLDELMEAVGQELGQLTGAEWGIATTGCEAAIALAVVACIAGTDPEKSQALPYVKGRDQVIIPKHSRNPYDFGVRMTGVEIVEVDTAEALRGALSSRTAMVYIYSSPAAESGPLSVANICAMAKAQEIPVFVDAAAEEPLVPNIHLQHGATLVGYSGGKCLRGPQSSGLLIGQKDLCRAAYFQASPHHNYGRAFKCSKEETMGLLAAVRQWYQRDHAAEQRAWLSWLEHIASRLQGLASLTTGYLHPVDLSNRSPRLWIRWDPEVLKTTGSELAARLDAGDPRIVLHEWSSDSVIVMPYMMEAGEEQIVADALYEGLTQPGHGAEPALSQGDPLPVQGRWRVAIHYTRGVGEQQFTMTQRGCALEGMQHGELYSAALTGEIHGGHIALRSCMAVPGSTLDWDFRGVAEKDTMTGTVDLGEYGTANWEAWREA